MEKKLSKEAICTHYADDPSRYMGAVNPPIFQTSLFTECEGNEFPIPPRISWRERLRRWKTARPAVRFLPAWEPSARQSCTI